MSDPISDPMSESIFATGCTPPSETAPVHAADDSVPVELQPDATQRHISETPGQGSPANSLPGEELTERQRTAIELMLQGLSDIRVAQRVGVDRVTVFRWRKKHAFRRDLERQRRLIWRQSVRRLQSMVTPALDVLHEQVTGEDPITALRAASILLRFATPGRLGRMLGDGQGKGVAV